MTLSTPFRRTMMSSGEIFLTLARTFIVLKHPFLVIFKFNNLNIKFRNLNIKILRILPPLIGGAKNRNIKLKKFNINL